MRDPQPGLLDVVDAVARRRLAQAAGPSSWRGPRPGTPSRAITAAGASSSAPTGAPSSSGSSTTSAISRPRGSRTSSSPVSTRLPVRGRSSRSTRRDLRWTRDEEPFESFLARLRSVDWRRGRSPTRRTRCAARGWDSDPATAVADGRGQLHDVEGRLDRRRVGVAGRAGRQPDDRDHGSRRPDGVADPRRRRLEPVTRPRPIGSADDVGP